MKTFQHFSPYNALQWKTVQGPKDSLSTNCKLFKGL